MRNILKTLLMPAYLLIGMTVYGQRYSASDSALLKKKQDSVLKYIQTKETMTPAIKVRSADKNYLSLDSKKAHKDLPESWFDIAQLLKECKENKLKGVQYTYPYDKKKTIHQMEVKDLEALHKAAMKAGKDNNIKKPRFLLVPDKDVQIGVLPEEFKKHRGIKDLSYNDMAISTGTLEKINLDIVQDAFYHEEDHQEKVQQGIKIADPKTQPVLEVEADESMLTSIGCKRSMRVIRAFFQVAEETRVKQGPLPDGAFNYNAYELSFYPEDMLEHPPSVVRLLLLNLQNDKEHKDLYEKVKKDYNLSK